MDGRTLQLSRVVPQPMTKCPGTLRHWLGNDPAERKSAAVHLVCVRDRHTSLRFVFGKYQAEQAVVVGNSSGDEGVSGIDVHRVVDAGGDPYVDPRVTFRTVIVHRRTAADHKGKGQQSSAQQ